MEGHFPNGADSFTCWVYLVLWIEARAPTAHGDPIVQMRWGSACACLAPPWLPGAS